MRPSIRHLAAFPLVLGLSADPAPASDLRQDPALGSFDRELPVAIGVDRVTWLGDGSIALDREAGTIRESVLPPSGDAPSVDERPACFLVPPGNDPGGAGVIELRLENLPGGPRSIELPAAGIEPLADVVRVRPLFDGEAITGFLFLERAPHRLRALDLDGRERFSTGGKGAGEGAFNFPADVAVDSRGRCYVADTDNHRIQRFGPDGRFQLAWGGRGAFPGLLAAPSSIDVEGDLVYVAEELNHRVSVFDTDGRFQYQWGMHAVVPREGEGRIHYPTCLDVSADGSRAVVLEPFERRIQCFTRLPGGLAEARSSPMPAKQDVSSHFGAQVAAEDDLLAMWEPETGSIAVFDVTTDTGLNITVFTNHGSGWDDLGRLGALHLDGARQELVVSDPVNDRLMTWRLERDRSTPIAYDPFMARLTSAIESEAMLADLRRLDPDRSWRRPRITGLARARIDGAPLVAVDRANDVLLELDARHRPRSIGAAGAGHGQLLAAGPGLLLLEPRGRELLARPLDPTGAPLGDPVELAFEGRSLGAVFLDGTLYLGSASGDRVEVYEEVLDPRPGEAARTPDRSWGGTGELDGRFWAPAGLARIRGDRLVVVDQGNHRAQIFAPDGTWRSTFTLSGGYTVPRPPAPAEDEPAAAGEGDPS